MTWVKQGSALILMGAFLSFIFTWGRRLLEDGCRRPEGSRYQSSELQAQDRKCKSEKKQWPFDLGGGGLPGILM